MENQDEISRNDRNSLIALAAAAVALSACGGGGVLQAPDRGWAAKRSAGDMGLGVLGGLP